MKVPHGSYVLVADGRKRLIARNDGGGGAPSLTVIDAAEDSNPPTSAQISDAAGRVAQPGGGGSSVGSADAHEIEEERFAVETAAIVGRRAEAGEFERLIVVAPPRMLGVLRKHYGAAIESRLAGEIASDFTGQPIDRIADALARH